MLHHQSIILDNIGLSFDNKVCFERFSARIHAGMRIGIIGSNGSGKSSLLKIIQKLHHPSEGNMHLSENITLGYVPQLVTGFEKMSGGERFQKALSAALAQHPQLLLLDEPTNHLDITKRAALLRMLDSYQGTLIIVSHDAELLQRSVNVIWHIHNRKVHQFSGAHDEYWKLWETKRKNLEHKIGVLNRKREETHEQLMREQERAKKRKIYGEKKYDGDKIALRSAQGRGALTHAANKRRIRNEKSDILESISELIIPEIVKPKFVLSEKIILKNQTIVSISNGSCGYDFPILKNIHFEVKAKERFVITGDNGSGKTTLLKAICGDSNVFRDGNWKTPTREHIGYLDQHYGNLDDGQTAFEAISNKQPGWTVHEIRDFLSSYLFKKNEEVYTKIKFLSGGEKSRLSLALIAAQNLSLVILDEVTNNIDAITKKHLINIINNFPGTLIMISHDYEFIEKILNIKEYCL